MKKIVILLVFCLSLIGLVGCADNSYNNEDVNVIFFTANLGASEVDSYLNVQPNSLISEPQEPTRQGYTFDGWYKDYQNTQKWDFSKDKVGETSIVLYAGWTPEEFQVIYDLNGGEMTTTDYVQTFYAGDFKVLPVARRSGYKFIGWFTYDWVDESSNIPGDAALTTVPKDQYEDLYVYAHYEAVAVRVSFVSNYPGDGGPANPTPVSLTYGDTINFVVLDDTATYQFVGWNTKPDGTGTFYNNGDTFERTQRITLYGIWKLIE